MRFDRIVFASRNRGKYSEIAAMMEPSGINVLFGPEIENVAVEETGKSYAENAILKAKQWSEATGIPCLADDSGIEIKCLDWWPGIYSSRIGNTDLRKNNIILEKLASETNRAARFVASFALVDPEAGETWLTMGFCWGNIARQPLGKSGFGYDPIFIPEGYDLTFGQLGQEEKGKISHRSVAMKLIFYMLSLASVIK